MTSKDARSKKPSADGDDVDKDKELLEEATQTIRAGMVGLANILTEEQPDAILCKDPGLHKKPVVRLEDYYRQLCEVGSMLEDAVEVCTALANETLKLQCATRGQTPSYVLSGHFGVGYRSMYKWNGKFQAQSASIKSEMDKRILQYMQVRADRVEMAKRARKAKKVKKAMEAAEIASAVSKKKKSKEKAARVM